VFTEPAETPYDLRWTMFGIPVRVHPLFWLVTAILGFNWIWPEGRDGPVQFEYFFIWIACVFVSILVHELGHVFAFRAFGVFGHVVLYSFGGLAVPDREPYHRWQRIVVSFAGPGAGFVFLAVLAAAYYGLTRAVHMERHLYVAFDMLVFINLYWGLINLLPIWPLDGGRVSRELFQARQGALDGARSSLWLSIVTAGVLACLMVFGEKLLEMVLRKEVQAGQDPYWTLLLASYLWPVMSPYNAILFLVLGVNNYLELQRLNSGGGGGGTRWRMPGERRNPWEQDADWWKSGRDPWGQ
jgi:Zn-dependent protease